MASRAALSQAVGLPLNVGMNPMESMGAPGMGDAPDGAVTVDMGGITTADSTLTEMPDGGVEIDPVPQDTKPEPTHTENLAEYMTDDDLNKVAESVLEGLRVDRESRKEWADGLAAGMEYLGLKMTDRDTPFPGASGVFDTIILEAVLRNQAQTCAELLPAAGPVKTQIIGIPTEQSEQKATRTKDFFNFYLEVGCPEWAEQMEQMFFWRALAGSVFKKTYQDPILNRPVSPFLTPDQVVVSYFCDSEMETVTRISHVFDSSWKEIKQRQLSGFYRDVEFTDPNLPEQTIIEQKVDSIQGTARPDAPTDSEMIDKVFELVEQHVDLDLEGYGHRDENGDDTGLPLPYIVTVERTSRKVLSIRKNWREDDDSYQRIQYFTHYRFLPGLGFYGIGFSQILGNPAKAGTALQRQMIDAATLEMFPGGLRVKGMRLSDNNVMIGPCSFAEIETGGIPIQQAVMTMPYKGPSEVSFNLWVKGRENAQGLGNMADISVGDGRQDAPVGTTLALLEAANRMMSATIKSAHRSFRKELKLFAALFGQYLPETPYPFPVPGGQQAIMRADFSDEIDVIPVSDPNITSYAQRVTRAEAMLRFAGQFPQEHDMHAALRNMYVEMGVDERKIEAILPDKKAAVPLDPLTENQNALTGKPLAVGAWQDHQAHIKSHQVLADQVPNLAAHIAEHLAAAMKVNVEKTLGMQIPPADQLAKMPPDVQNRVAVLVAQALEKLNSPEGKEPTPGQIAMAEIQVEAKKVDAMLQEITARATTTAFQAQKKFLNDQADRQQRAQDAEAERQTKMQLALMKAQTDRAKVNAIGRKPTAYN